MKNLPRKCGNGPNMQKMMLVFLAAYLCVFCIVMFIYCFCCLELPDQTVELLYCSQYSTVYPGVFFSTFRGGWLRSRPAAHQCCLHAAVNNTELHSCIDQYVLYSASTNRDTQVD